MGDKGGERGQKSQTMGDVIYGHSLDGEKITYQAQYPFHRQTSEHEPSFLH